MSGSRLLNVVGVIWCGLVLLALLPLIILKTLQLVVGVILGFIVCIPGLILMLSASAAAKAIGNALPSPKREAWFAFVEDPDGWGFHRFGIRWYLIVVGMYVAFVAITAKIMVVLFK